MDKATKNRPWVNSLGMKFVPVVGTQVLFSIWDTRVNDFETFVNDTGYDATEGVFSLGKQWVEANVVRHGKAGSVAATLGAGALLAESPARSCLK